MAVVGPGATQEKLTDVKPLLEGYTEQDYVTILNPLEHDFAIRVGQDIPINMPTPIHSGTTMVQSENDVVRNYGFNLKGKDFVGRKHIVNDTIIKSGATLTLRGNEAQVAVRQLVNEILQREGKTRLSADPNLRNEVEQRIIVAHGPIQDILSGSFQSANAQIDNALSQYNGQQDKIDEPAFPELTQPESKRVGRPKKSTN